MNQRRGTRLNPPEVLLFREDSVEQKGAELAEAIDWAQGMRGNSKLLIAPPGNDPNGLVIGAANLGVNTQPLTLLDTDLRKYGAMLGAGTYQLAIQSKYKAETELNVTVPVICQVTYGAGGISNTFEVDADNQVVAIPADATRLSVFWDTLPFEQLNAYVPDVEVIATLVRSGQSSPNRVTRSHQFFWPGDGGDVILPIPPFANAWRVYAWSSGDLSGDLATWAAQVMNKNTVRDKVFAGDMAKYVRGACSRPIPAGCDTFHMGRTEPAIGMIVTVEFELSFGARG